MRGMGRKQLAGVAKERASGNNKVRLVRKGEY